jgi:hypothetical protein
MEHTIQAKSLPYIQKRDFVMKDIEVSEVTKMMLYARL